ncbi:hypothetical protein SAMN04487996_11758 [Dyadobacter soli]|uniref:Uncharacterized protein n=1 Tax=Dyadobacter soli TaxID=659014 RepID=A0A1G7T1T1_9BACT|nr:hypothetical protein [Dyadobacter soli]SDG29178.1 hypothetical protein SAMN04487996_11758 [Dyadobacter soli]
MKYILIIALTALTGITATAQSRFRTDESIGSQLKKGTAPGLLFSKDVAAKKDTLHKPTATGGYGQQLRTNTLPGRLYKPASEAKPETSPAVPVKREGE